MKVLLLIFFCLAIAGLLFLTACQPIYVYKKVEIPIRVQCKVRLPRLSPLPSDAIMPAHLTIKQERDWMLSQMYDDIVLLEGEVQAEAIAAKGCE